MASHFELERRRLTLALKAGISNELERLRQEGWTIERMRFLQGSGTLDLTVSRRSRSEPRRPDEGVGGA